MIMIEQYVKANSLSCLLNQDSRIEVLPEPFRMQSSLSLRVTYSEYRNYILSLQSNTLIKLCAERDLLHALASTENPKLYNYFLRDMAFAIAKEVFYAEWFNKDATVIVPATLDSGNTVSVSSYVQLYDYYSKSEIVLRNSLYSAGFKFDTIKRIHNVNLYKLAVILQALSELPTVMKEISLVYDQ